MSYPKFVRFLALGLAASVLASPSFAQATEDHEADEQLKPPPGFVLPPRLRQIAFRDANPWTFHVNARYNTGKPSVDFMDVGTVPSLRTLPGADQTDYPARAYDDGYVVLDSYRENELDENDNPTTTPGGRYTFVPDEDSPDVYYDLLAYTPGQTRTWGYLQDSQQGNGTIAMNAFSAQSTGTQLSAEHDGSSIGFEMAVARRLFKLGSKTEIGFNASIGLTDVKAERNERVISDLITLTDVYQVYGDLPDAPYDGPSFENLFDDLGNIILQDGYEITNPLQQITADRTITVTAGGAQVDGSYKVKGAYYSIRLGPEIRSHLTEKLAVTAGFGFVGAYVGSDFTVTETLDLGDYAIAAPITITEANEYKDMIAGFYGELSVEYWFTPRTAFFFGGVYESIDDFVQSLGGRSAVISVGNNLIVRVGIITRF